MLVIPVNSLTEQSSQQYMVVLTNVIFSIYDRHRGPIKLASFICQLYKLNGRNINDKMGTLVQHQSMFNSLACDGPAVVGMPFAQPFHAAGYKLDNQTRMTHVNRSGNQKVGAEGVQIAKMTRETNSGRAYQLLLGLASVMALHGNVAANPTV